MKGEIIFFSYSNFKPTDGGMARNHAFYNEMKKRDARIYNHTSVLIYYRFFCIIRNLMLLFFLRKKKILILQSVFLKFMFPFMLFRYPVFRSFVRLVLNRAVKNNMLTIEINDLIYEQGIDLGDEINETASSYQKFIFSHDKLRFIFASQLMADYAAEKYGLKKKNLQTVINGAPTFNADIVYDLKVADHGKIKYIYAGTLNKGRDIEKLIEVFAESPTVELILIGIEGDWIGEFNYSNIHYLGQFDEEVALAVAAQCDVGIIPYNEDKLYYNICYPTKNSFYIAAGLPILSTPLQETMRVFGKYPGTAFFESFKNWQYFIKKIDKSEVISAKRTVQKIKTQLMWEFLFQDLYITDS